ncbi:ComEA family DNA-binding protein [Yinghuangia seranimata]|uniref:ComEA family DNA-binding protein n=1 Tax=Yinghuangia seranimata TaxID=408067 RepID=UPI00248AFB8E|nr:ComEA family DNA-binding protein [Yinghuangia seranimata]MDI2127440.1 ComEA family DNA-binding protein [Yinghuangia seranimata]
MTNSATPPTLSRLAALFPPTTPATGAAEPGQPVGPGVPPPRHPSVVDPASVDSAYSLSDGHPPPEAPWVPPPERSSVEDEPVPLATGERLVGALSDRIPPGVKALRVGVDRRAVFAVAVLALLAVVLAVVGWWQARPHEVAVPPPVAASSSGVPSTAAKAAWHGASSAAEPSPVGPPASSAGGPVAVHVVGHVARSGLFTLPAGSRVDDALKAAGGVLPGTDLSTLNLARQLTDGEQIPVGVPGATPPFAAAPGRSGAAADPRAVVDLNTATVEQLEALPGIGPVMAAHILDWRRDHGRFSSVDQLREIRGIGERRLQDLRPRVRV